MIEDIKRYKLTYTIIILNSIVYLFSSFFSHDFIDMDMETLVNMGAMFGPYVIQESQWWRLGSAMFLHGGITHLLMNMFSLYIIGRGAEMYFSKNAYISIYFFAGLIGGLVSLFVHPNSVGVGASGAIFGMFGALAGFFLAHRDTMATQAKAFMKDFGMIIGINLVIGLSIPSVDVSAHLGGLVVGVLGGFVLSKNLKWIYIYAVAMMLLALMMGEYLSSEYISALV
ncbi:MAG: rhomboid family intramembrane serine protease [Sulfurovum sp.]|nr:rhomboid family intramembrane serine protease [Sulfurovum sp.]